MGRFWVAWFWGGYLSTLLLLFCCSCYVLLYVMLIAFVSACLVRYHHILSCYIWEKPWVLSGVHGNYLTR
ncbi:hypothetical protein BO85DRAFT_444683 [Aspergillus piperis CBS 112811]|uniref:Uncharacterized protein n=1 Tax=Aspergillus piperis CBS 112811 TaxID=1448313 RepID=A0A8G1RB36_9EURO|nr:hypothetical protein BO85DRAFT_444683 [Aspergillus piperis CBS 112811]RAH63401.1 hypothetical protein BO85DRAFT_444683 [Aspergillus piperis CBS 112811]